MNDATLLTPPSAWAELHFQMWSTYMYTPWSMRTRKIWLHNDVVRGEDAHHSHGCARCENVTRTQRSWLSGACIVCCVGGTSLQHTTSLRLPCKRTKAVLKSAAHLLFVLVCVVSACKCVGRESISTAVGCWSVRTLCVVSMVQVLTRTPCKCGEHTFRLLLVLISAHTVRCKSRVRSCKVRSAWVTCVFFKLNRGSAK